MSKVTGRSWIAALALVIGVGFAVPAQAGFFDDLLVWVAEKFMSAAKASPEARAFQADLMRYRVEVKAMPPQKAVEGWLALYDRALKLGGDAHMLSDAETEGPLGVGAMFGALPAPEAWPALREAAKARAEKAPADSAALGLRFATELLVADHAAAKATLKEIEALGKRPGAEDWRLRMVAEARAEMAELYGTREEIAASFAALLDASAKEPGTDVEVPDLAGLVGEARAAQILREALKKPVTLRIPAGTQTRALARRIATDEVASLGVAQWGLVDNVEAGTLYEALDKRFKAEAAQRHSMSGYYRGEADRYYFLYLVLKGRHAEAEKAMDRLVGRGALHLPKQEVEALQRAGQRDALQAFLHALLARRPQMNAWEVYIRESAYLRKSAQALELVERQLARKDLPADVLSTLRFRRVDVLLAADRVDPAIAELRSLLAEPPRKGEADLRQRTSGALRLAGLGRVLEKRELTDAGLAFARAAFALPAEGEGSWYREDMQRKLLAELRKNGRGEEALALAQAQLGRAPAGGPMSRYSVVDREARAAAAELAGIHAEAKRHKEVLALLDESPGWGAADLRGILGVKDSLGVPVGLAAARALAETGRKPQAIAVARALVDALPGYDPGYEFLVSIDPDAHAFLDRLYAADQFEERPLVWKGILYVRAKRWMEAESVIRQAITIDPSDGEEGPNDRMRAYAVLADVLEAKGAKAPAATFRGAVRAIRISERTDELHDLGLHERAFAGYRKALEQFADAYCIQSRLAIRLMEAGRREEAFEHYRRAYELMPSSFGRVESHCFGCESVFQGAEQQTLAERVFNQLLAREPKKPQIHYLLGYLNKERGRYGDALKRFGESVRLDPEYLNAWKHLHELGKSVYIEPKQSDRARLKLLQLDPRQRHVRYDLDTVSDLAALWRAANAVPQPRDTSPLYPLPKSAKAVEEALAKIPEPMRAHAPKLSADYSVKGQEAPTPYSVLGKHKLLRTSGYLASGA